MELEYDLYNNGNIVYFKNVIKNHEEIIAGLNSFENNLITKWYPWGKKYATSNQQKQSLELLDYGVAKSIYNPNIDYKKELNECHFIYNSINEAVLKCINEYTKILNIDTNSNPKIESNGFVVGRYNPGQTIGAHIDCPYDDLEHSFVIYLNDNYNGGEIDFYNLNLRIKPVAGSIIMFKSSDPYHEHGTKPADDYKYMSPYFWRMGPSQGFIPYGTSVEEYFEYFDDEKNITDDFETLQRYI